MSVRYGSRELGKAMHSLRPPKDVSIPMHGNKGRGMGCTITHPVSARFDFLCPSPKDSARECDGMALQANWPAPTSTSPLSLRLST